MKGFTLEIFIIIIMFYVSVCRENLKISSHFCVKAHNSAIQNTRETFPIKISIIEKKDFRENVARIISSL